jgi:HJR/Mrr/RecB family endonuclease
MIENTKNVHDVGERIRSKVEARITILPCAPISPLTIGDEWFACELRVKRWFETNGYEVVHLSGSRNGDGGVDIQAQKGSENLLVQCKYRKEKVGPGAIRELLGSLATFPEGSRGVLVSSSELTPGAREPAQQHGIQFIEGVDFMADLDLRVS